MGKESADLIGEGVGGEIEIGGFGAGDDIPDSPSDKVALKVIGYETFSEVLDERRQGNIHVWLVIPKGEVDVKVCVRPAGKEKAAP